ncbi:NAD-dependent succinate-semialdehyde dehydrogenase [Bordetella genomosp. 12]|uniref:NAD-dependent succinate-semialdehyde dehydrogenase n=1 Tax=Bordetella genomosp. 12 TaxID=463035 RepID=UPI001FC9B7C4|nr:NAD-dependent succinate-semialdehyde dehydrogenase [Bordetella genomosp. 12]
MESNYPALGLFIHGKWIYDRAEGEDVVNPATGDILARLPHADTQDLLAAAQSAKAGFAVWRAMPLAERTTILQRAVDLIRERSAAIGHAMTLDQGKPVKEAITEVNRAASLIEWDLNQAQRLYGHIIPGRPGFQRYTLRQPIGPVAAFTPWNFPGSVMGRKMGGALAAGCSLVVKAAEETPSTACAFVRCFEDAGLPPGVLNLVFGVPAKISEYLIAREEIRAISFTGSVPVGKHLAALAASHMKPAVMELGGSSPVIICKDTDVRAAARALGAAKFRNAGQICTAPTRFIVDRAVVAAFTDELVAYASALRLGNGLDAGTTMGPMANPRRLQAMQTLVDDARQRGATIRCGGKSTGQAGFFFEPTVVADTPLDSLLMTTEPFGPIAPVIGFDSLDEAIRIANDTPYGLAAYAYTESSASAHRLAEALDCGILSINHGEGAIAEAPFGGVKDSGYGREGGEQSLDAYTVVKFVSHRATAEVAA